MTLVSLFHWLTVHVVFVLLMSEMAKRFIDQEPDIPFYDVHEVIVPHLGHIPIAKGDFNRLPKKAQRFIAFYVSKLKGIDTKLDVFYLCVCGCDYN